MVWLKSLRRAVNQGIRLLVHRKDETHLRFFLVLGPRSELSGCVEFLHLAQRRFPASHLRQSKGFNKQLILNSRQAPDIFRKAEFWLVREPVFGISPESGFVGKYGGLNLEPPVLRRSLRWKSIVNPVRRVPTMNRLSR